MPVSIVLDCISRLVLPKYRYVHLVFFDAFLVQKRRGLRKHFSYSKETKSKSSLLYRLVKFSFSQASDLPLKEVVNTFWIWCSIYILYYVCLYPVQGVALHRHYPVRIAVLRLASVQTINTQLTYTFFILPKHSWNAQSNPGRALQICIF